jgi:hypothetical protein
MGKEIQLSARQCRGNYLEALERQEQGWPLYSSWKSCLACLTWALKLEEVTSCQLPVASKDKEKLPVASNQLPVKAKAETGRRPKPQAPAPAPACLVAHLPWPDARPGLQARRGGDRVQRGIEDARWAVGYPAIR